MNKVFHAHTKVSCKVAISGLSANLLMSLSGERADLQLKQQSLDTKSQQVELTMIRHHQPVHVPLPCLQVLWKHNTIPLLCSIYTIRLLIQRKTRE